MSKENLEKIQRLAVMNSLNLTKLSMFGGNSVVKVNKASSLGVLLAIDVEKKS